jgi:hypothetical protein
MTEHDADSVATQVSTRSVACVRLNIQRPSHRQ